MNVLIITASKNKVVRTIVETGQELLTFLRNPDEQLSPQQTLLHKCKRLIAVLVINFILLSLVLPILSGIDALGLVDTDRHKLEELMTDVSAGAFIVLGVIVIPFLEELIFRLWLTLKRNYFIWPFTIIVSLTGQKNLSRFKSFIKRKWQQYYKVIVYTSAILFALVHLSNFEYSGSMPLLLPLMVIPQFITGLLISYLRVKYGFIWGFYLHALSNLVLTTLWIVSIEDYTEIVNTTTGDYQLKIEEVNHSEDKTVLSNHLDSIDYRNAYLKSLIAQLLHKEEKLISFYPEQGWNERVNVVARVYTDSLALETILLNELQKAYNFTISRNSTRISARKLVVGDSARLRQNISTSSEKSSRITINSIDTTVNNTTIYQTKITIENASLNQLVEVLNKHYDELITARVLPEGRFDFVIKKGNIDQLNQLLQKKYGLHLQKADSQIDQLEVVRQ